MDQLDHISHGCMDEPATHAESLLEFSTRLFQDGLDAPYLPINHLWFSTKEGSYQKSFFWEHHAHLNVAKITFVETCREIDERADNI